MINTTDQVFNLLDSVSDNIYFDYLDVARDKLNIAGLCSVWLKDADELKTFELDLTFFTDLLTSND